MSAALITVLVLVFMAYAAYSIKIMVEFGAFCERIALSERRMEDYAEVRGADEGGMNAFAREQYQRIMEGDFDSMSDPALVSKGRYLASRFRRLFAGAVLLIIVVALAAGT